MYGQNHQQGNVFANGSHASQRYNMQMNKSFQPNHQTQPQSHHRQQQAQHEHNGYSSHQHNTSNSNFNVAPAHVNSAQLRNSTPSHTSNGMGRPPNDEWVGQLALYEQAREQTGTHPHARNLLSVGKASGSTSLDQIRKEIDRDEKTRIVRDTEQEGWTELDLGGQGLPAISLDLFNYKFLRKLYLNNNRLSRVPPAIYQLRNLTYMDLSFNRLHEIPPELGMLINLKTLLLFANKIETLPFELGFLYQLELFGVAGNPLNERDLALIEEHGTKALMTELQESAEPMPPSDREWRTIGEAGNHNVNAEDSFTVMSFNALCEKAATKSMYGYTPSNFLAWSHRKQLILGECRMRNADIICLQEVEHDQYNEYFRPQLAHHGYKGTFWPKSRARTMNPNEAKLVDGCATLWKNSKYIQLDKQTLEFTNIALNRPDMKGDNDMYNRVMPRDNIAVCVFLEDRITGARLLVVNAHLFWDQRFKDVKLVQSAIMMEQVNRLAETYVNWPATPLAEKMLYRFSGGDNHENGGASPPLEEQLEPGPSQSYPDAKSIPLLVCIDANSTPDSGVYELITSGALPRNHPDLGDYTYGKFTTEGMRHDFNLKSAYTFKDIPFTNYTGTFTGMIDYIFYAANSFQVTGLLGEVDPAYLRRVPGFPNIHFPSDHICLVTRFVVKQRKGERRQ